MVLVFFLWYVNIVLFSLIGSVLQYKDQPGNKDISLLGGFAQALTRLELNEAAVKDIVGALEKLTGNDWDEAQVSHLIFLVTHVQLITVLLYLVSCILYLAYLKLTGFAIGDGTGGIISTFVDSLLGMSVQLVLFSN